MLNSLWKNKIKIFVFCSFLNFEIIFFENANSFLIRIITKTYYFKINLILIKNMLFRILIILSFILSIISCSPKDKAEYQPTKKNDPYVLYKEGLDAFRNNDYFFQKIVCILNLIFTTFSINFVLLHALLCTIIFMHIFYLYMLF